MRTYAPSYVARCLAWVLAGTALAAGTLHAQLANGPGRRTRAGVMARIATMQLGVHERQIVQLLTQNAPFPSPASIEIVHGLGNVTYLGSDERRLATPRPQDTRTAWLVSTMHAVAIDGEIDSTRPDPRGPDGVSPVRTMGAVSLRGDPVAAVGVLRVGNEDRVIYTLRGDRLTHALAPCNGDARHTVCGLVFVCAGSAVALEPATLQHHPDLCAHAVSAVIEAARNAMRGAPDVSTRGVAFFDAAWVEIPGAGDSPLPRGHPRRVAWEADMAAALARAGVSAADVRRLLPLQWEIDRDSR